VLLSRLPALVGVMEFPMFAKGKKGKKKKRKGVKNHDIIRR